MTRFEMFRALFEPTNGWYDDRTAHEAFDVWEKSKTNHLIVQPNTIKKMLEELLELHRQLLAKSVQVFTRGATAETEYNVLIQKEHELIDKIIESKADIAHLEKAKSLFRTIIDDENHPVHLVVEAEIHDWLNS